MGSEILEIISDFILLLKALTVCPVSRVGKSFHKKGHWIREVNYSYCRKQSFTLEEESGIGSLEEVNTKLGLDTN